MKFKCIYAVLAVMVWSNRVSAQILPPGAIWTGLPQVNVNDEDFKEIGLAINISCRDQYPSRYGEGYPDHGGKCYEWHNSQYSLKEGQVFEQSFCFYTYYRDEKLITSDTDTLLLLIFNGQLGVSKFPKENLDIDVEKLRVIYPTVDWDAKYLLHKYKPIYPIDCKTLKQLPLN